MHRPLSEQHRWFAGILRGHNGYFGMPHNWLALNGFPRQIQRIWLVCLRRRSQKSRRTGWGLFEHLMVRFPSRRLGSLIPGLHARHDAGYFREEPGAGKPHARICEGEAEWPSYSTTTRVRGNGGGSSRQRCSGTHGREGQPSGSITPPEICNITNVREPGRRIGRKRGFSTLSRTLDAQLAF